MHGISCRQRVAEVGNNQGSPDSAAAQQKVAEVDQLYRQRDDLAKVRLGVALLRQARVADYGNYEAAWKLAKFNYYLGAHSDDDRERDAAFREGIEAGKSAVQLGSDKPDGHFWLGANYGGSAEQSTLAGLANVEDIRSEMEAVLKIDEGYQAGSAYLALGQLYLRAPRVLGGDASKAIEYLEKGLKFGRDNALLRVNLAEAYHSANRDGEARKHIDIL
ncbi:MAG: TRAP transporter TatT component family protein, partial [Pyrinomonadaceae bacterium]